MYKYSYSYFSTTSTAGIKKTMERVECRWNNARTFSVSVFQCVAIAGLFLVAFVVAPSGRRERENVKVFILFLNVYHLNRSPKNVLKGKFGCFFIFFFTCGDRGR
jgi:hypothetical protein